MRLTLMVSQISTKLNDLYTRIHLLCRLCGCYAYWVFMGKRIKTALDGIKQIEGEVKMKKLIVSLVLLMGLSFSVNATSPATFISGAAIPVAFFTFAYAASEVEYKACNDKPYRTVSWKDSNYLFDVSECDHQKNKDSYK